MRRWNQPSVLCVCTIHWMSVCVTHGQKTWLDHGPWPWETQTFRVFHCAFAKSNLTDVFAHTLFRVSSHILKYLIWVFCACLFQFLPWLDLAVLASIFTIIHENLGESCWGSCLKLSESSFKVLTQQTFLFSGTCLQTFALLLLVELQTSQ